MRLFLTAIAFVFLFACTPQTSNVEQPVTSLSLEIPEVHTGILQGYLEQEDLPNSLVLLGPPPEDGSAAFALDQEKAAMFVALEDEARKAQAVKDAILYFPEATEAYNIILKTKITEESTPHLYIILRRSLADAGGCTYGAKNKYQRQRPFVVNDTPTCTPDDEEMLRGDGSYPSGHTAVGWAWALILAEVFPDQADAILERGKEFGLSRNVCNAHWHSDVVAGRLMGAAAVARLHANEQFVIDLNAAKAEINEIRSK
jgi:acid phosphatase (class A)